MDGPSPFLVRDCVLSSFSTGLRAQNLRELRDKIAVVSLDSIYYHFWGSRLSSRFEHPEYHNNFAAWVHHSLHDHLLGERLGVIDPTAFSDMEKIRQELIEIIEQRLDETEQMTWSNPDDQFYFIRSRLIVFDTSRVLTHPMELPNVLPTLSAGSIFYHFIDARLRVPDCIDDFRAWLKGFGDEFQPLVDALATLDLYFTPLMDLRKRLIFIATEFFEKHIPAQV